MHKAATVFDVFVNAQRRSSGVKLCKIEAIPIMQPSPHASRRCIGSRQPCHRHLSIIENLHRLPSPSPLSHRAVPKNNDATPTTATSNDHPQTRRDALIITTASPFLVSSSIATTADAASLQQEQQQQQTQFKAREAKMVMRVTALRGSVPGSWVQDFSTAMEGFGTVAITQRPQIVDIWEDLKGESIRKRPQKKGRKKKVPKPTTVDAVSLGDGWMASAIAQGLIQPIPDARDRRYWEQVSPRWRQLVTRHSSTGLCCLPSGNGRKKGGGAAAAADEDDKCQVYGIPYRWGCTTVLYRRDTAARWAPPPSGSSGSSNQKTASISDWDDLLLPGLKNRIACIDSPREVVGIALKTLGLGYNATLSDITACGLREEDVAARLAALVGQIKVFSNTDHVRAMQSGEVDVVIGWSDDLVPLEQRAASAEMVVPLSGTALWADVWCVPSGAAGGAEDGEASPLLPAWFELGLQPSRARASLRGGASPLVLPSSSSSLGGREEGEAVCTPIRGTNINSKIENGEEARVDVGGLPSPSTLKRSEFLLPLDAETAAMYGRLLERVAAAV